MAANGRIEPGQSVSSAISARAWNRAQDAADIVLGVRSGFAAAPAGAYPGSSAVVLVRNLTSADVGAYHVLRISGSGLQQGEHDEMPPIAQPFWFFGSLPTRTDQDIVITLEPIKTNGYGRAVISGVVAFRLERSSDTVGVYHDYATVKSGETKTLKSSGFGFVRILSSNPMGPDGWGWAIGVLGTYPYGHRLCRTANTTFTKGTFQTLQVFENGTPPDETVTTGETVTVYNKYASIPAGKFISVAYHGNGRWYVVAAECS